MATAGLGVLALVAGTAGGIAALTSNDKRVVSAAGQSPPVVDLPAAGTPVQPPAGQTGLGAGTVGHAAAGAVARGPVAHAAGPVGHAQAEREVDETRRAPNEADRRATRSPRRTASVGRPRTGGGAAAAPGAGAGAAPAAPPAAGVPAGPQIRTEQISETEAIPFRTTLVRDPSLPRGTREIETPGVPGERLLRYEVTYTGNRETSRRLLDSTVTREPQDRVVAFGGRKRGGQHSGGHDRSDRGHGHGHGRDCRLLSACLRMGRSAVCIVGNTADPRKESIIDGDLSLLDPSDIDELDLVLPCEDELDADRAAAADVEASPARG